MKRFLAVSALLSVLAVAGAITAGGVVAKGGGPAASTSTSIGLEGYYEGRDHYGRQIELLYRNHHIEHFFIHMTQIHGRVPVQHSRWDQPCHDDAYCSQGHWETSHRLTGAYRYNHGAVVHFHAHRSPYQRISAR